MFYGLLVPCRSHKSEIETPRRSGGMALRVAYLLSRRYLAWFGAIHCPVNGRRRFTLSECFIITEVANYEKREGLPSTGKACVPRKLSRSPEYRRHVRSFLTAIPKAFFCPIRITSFLPRVIPV